RQERKSKPTVIPRCKGSAGFPLQWATMFAFAGGSRAVDAARNDIDSPSSLVGADAFVRPRGVSRAHARPGGRGRPPPQRHHRNNVKRGKPNLSRTTRRKFASSVRARV